MEIRQLEYFVAVADEKNFGRAANRLHVVQSAVSAGIQTLERDLATSLFDRRGKRTELTDAGEALLPRARRALDAMRDARDAVSEVSGGLSGTLRVGTLTSIPLVDIPAVLGEFHRQHPGVKLVTGGTPSGSAGLVASLLEHRLDLAFVSLPAVPPVGIDVTLLGRAPLMVALPHGHRLANRPHVTLHDLADEDFVDLPPGFGNRELVDRAFSAAGLSRRVALEITDIGTAVQYVQYGLGVSVLPEFLLNETPGVTVVRIDGDLPWWSVGVASASNRALGSAGKALLEIIQQAVLHGSGHSCA
ncbi:LysR family transcriptional regulator [Leifsonia kafniensis]|uniref:LysR family transcriptional regulator n=1 Tax=Leifsonia kafniensis TaxID=475957 RepID=A0ABP7JZU3_9MICO